MRSEPKPSTDDQPLITAGTAAELQVPASLEARVFKVLAVANAGVADQWRGRQLGSITFLAPAAACNGLRFYGYAVSHPGRCLFEGAGVCSEELAASQLTMRVVAREVGARPGSLIGTQPDAILGLLMQCLPSFAAQVRLEQGPPASVSS